jgi:site-specific recombinase XerD
MKKPGVAVSDFNAHIQEWLDSLPQFNHQPSSIAANAKDVSLFRAFCRQHHIRTIKGKTLLRFMTWLHDKRNNRSGTINRKRSSLCMYFRHLRLMQIPGAKELPVESLPRARDAYRGPVKVLEPDEVSNLLGSIDGASVIARRDFALFTLQYSLGLRLGEVLAIDIEDINFRENLITIHGKGRRERTLPLVKHIVSLLQEWLIFRKALLGSDESEALFLSKKGNRLSLRAAEENFQKFVTPIEALKDRHIVPHTLRHSFASHALENGDDMNKIVVLKAILGHARMKSTEIYLHPSITLQRMAINDHLSSDILTELREKRTGIFKIQSTRASAKAG